MSPNEDIEKYLSKKDRVLSRLIKIHGHSTIAISEKRDPFDSLVSSVISQQLSSKVSERIKDKLEALIGQRPFNPESILSALDEDIRGCGISRAKIKTIKGLATEASKGRFKLKDFKNFSDEDAIKYLSSFWGIGQWTAEMFLMFTLKRLNILPTNDAGINRAHKLLYPESKSLLDTAENWKPYRSIGCWYMWKHIDNP